MTGSRFAKVRPGVGQTQVPQPEATPVEAAPSDVVPPTLRKAEPRSPLGVRAKPSLQANLSALVEEYKAKGWDVSQHTLLEHWLRRLGDPEYAQAFMTDLARTGES